MHRLLLALALLAPSIAFAHPGDHGGLTAGFSHPFSGWDHMVVMVAVGLWAAQTRRWWLPFAFVSVLTLGASAALFGLSVPGLETAILGSTIVGAALVLFKVRAPAMMSFAIVALFAFFHGVAHGAEIPADSNAVRFVFGFVGASLGLHGVGYGVVWLGSKRDARAKFAPNA